VRHNTPLVECCKYLTHQQFPKISTGETVIQFPTKAARCNKFSSPEERRLSFANDASPPVRTNSVKTAVRPPGHLTQRRVPAPGLLPLGE
jgi:hypothetical protein